jgi:hypothetical protein
MNNTLYMSYLFKFFIIFLNKTNGRTLDTETYELSFFWNGGSSFQLH